MLVCCAHDDPSVYSDSMCFTLLKQSSFTGFKDIFAVDDRRQWDPLKIRRLPGSSKIFLSHGKLSQKNTGRDCSETVLGHLTLVIGKLITWNVWSLQQEDIRPIHICLRQSVPLYCLTLYYCKRRMITKIILSG